ncbi:hypothetical protein I3760_15G102900 [Carya illinoinensis]|nr:hypothetical protein I3760_15G102900 [Carya illinoinensis]
MSSGLPTFATDWGGPAEIIVDGISAFHVDLYNGDELSRKIVDFFEMCKADPENLNKISKASLWPINKSYTWKIYANKLLNMDEPYLDNDDVTNKTRGQYNIGGAL